MFYIFRKRCDLGEELATKRRSFLEEKNSVQVVTKPVPLERLAQALKMPSQDNHTQTLSKYDVL